MPHSKPNAEGFKVYRSSIRDCRCQNYLVPCRSLADICAEHAPRDIHFLKIDVEGMERSVLEGSDFKHFRPWLLAIEATVPCTYTPCHEEWEHIVAGYEFALFHQINRYYVAREHAADLKGWIQPPVYTNARRCA